MKCDALWTLLARRSVVHTGTSYDLPVDGRGRSRGGRIGSIRWTFYGFMISIEDGYWHR